MEGILEAVKASETKVLTEIKSIKQDMSEIKSDINIHVLKEENMNLKVSIQNITTKSNILEVKSNETGVNVMDLCELTENIRLDIDYLKNVAEATNSRTDTLEENTEQLNRDRMANNMRIFGL